MRGILKIALKAVGYYKKQVFYQFAIIFLLCAVITGSLLTGSSVKTSLKKTASLRLGNTGIVASSGNRFLNPDLSGKLKKAGFMCTGLFESRGSVTNLGSQAQSNSLSLYAVQNDFFTFQGKPEITVDSGKIVINRKLADHLKLKEGDETIVRLAVPSDIPGDAPFSPSLGQNISVVFKIGAIIEPVDNGNFSLAISQISPENAFMNLDDLMRMSGHDIKINRLLSDSKYKSTAEIQNTLKLNLEPEDIGLKVRYVNATGSCEMISDRVFIDSVLVSTVQEKIPGSYPVITYLANNIKSRNGSTPYSFVSALPGQLYPDVPSGDSIIINQWLSEDLHVVAGDSLRIKWFAPDSLNHLIERTRLFIVGKVVQPDGIWADRALMPEFPGIARSESCSGWDAGVQINMNEIRAKDEAYWKLYRGTPKAFINYETGKKIWGNNFGPATSIRFPSGMSSEAIRSRLATTFSPDIAGIAVTDLFHDSLEAADKSVDFSSLFLGLGFFLIMAALVLLSFIVSSFFEIRKPQVYTLYALGFKNRMIQGMLLSESAITALVACIPGSLAGYLVNGFITMALNTVWKGAVQTNTLNPDFAIVPVITGFLASLIMVTGIEAFMAGRYLKRLRNKEGRNQVNVSSPIKYLVFSGLAFIAAFTCLILSFKFDSQRMILSFISGILLLFSLLLFWRLYYSVLKKSKGLSHRNGLFRLYYSYNPSAAIAPIAFISAGIFAFFITTANRKDFGSLQNERSSGTGGYLLWAETTIPVREDLNTVTARSRFGLDEDNVALLSFVQMKRSPGNDASCLNLNHITAPPILGIDADKFISGQRFSFAKTLDKSRNRNPWSLLDERPGPNAFYGIADQTVLDWGLKLSVGDTLVLRAENGQPVNIIIAAGLQSSVFQGYVLISKKYFNEIYPSVTGSNVMLVEGNPDSGSVFINALKERFEIYGIDASKTSDRLAGFYQITNTYLSVFGVFGGLGMVIGIAGLGFVLLRNFNQRKREFGLMLATGFSFRKIRNAIFSEQVLILSAGILSGIIPAIIATLPSLKSSHEIPWFFMLVMIFLIFLSGFCAILLSLSSIKEKSLVQILRKE